MLFRAITVTDLHYTVIVANTPVNVVVSQYSALQRQSEVTMQTLELKKNPSKALLKKFI